MLFRSDARELGVFDARTPAQRARSSALRAAIEQRLTEDGLGCWIPVLDTQYGLVPFTIGASDIPQDVRLLAGEYDRLGLPIGMFMVPVGAPGYLIETDPC